MEPSRFFLTAACTALCCYAAYADDDGPCCHDNAHPRWYAQISGSAVFLDPVSITHPSFTVTVTGTDRQTFHPGYGMSGAVGYKVFSGVRTELEVTERISDVKKDSGATNVIPSGETSEQKSTAFMANAYIDLHNKSNYTPYFGAGIGEALVSNPRYYTIGLSGTPTGKLSGWTLAYQFMTGVNYTITDSPFELFLGYRYFTGQDLKATLTAVPGVNFSLPNTSQNIELGGRMYF